MKLHLTEEIMLLVLHDDGGEFAKLRDWPLRCALAGGILADLVLAGRLAATPRELTVRDARPLDSPLLDPALATMAAADAPCSPRYWVDHFAQQADRLRTEALENLIAHDILHLESGLFHWAHGSRRYPFSVEEVEVKLRILGVLLENETPAPRDIVLIHLAHACHILRKLLPHLQLQQAAARIEEVCQLDEAAQPVLDAIMDSEVAAGPSHGRPEAAKLPVVGNLHVLLSDDHFLMPRLYAELGPVFRLSILGNDLSFMAGPEANRFLARHGDRHLRTFERRQDMNDYLGGARSLITATGQEHARLRKQFQKTLDRQYGLSRISDIVAIVRRRLASWPTGEPLPATHAMLLLMTEVQLLILNGVPSDGDEEQWIRFGHEAQMNNQKAMHTADSEKFKKSCRQMRTRIQRIIERYRLSGDDSAKPAFIGRLMALHEEDPVFMPETDLPAQIGIISVTGAETVASTAAFIMHALFENPELMARATAEADALFADGLPAPAALNKLDILRRTMMEVLRLWPVAFLAARVVSNPFDFGGYRFSAGEEVNIGTAAPHLLEEFYPDPGRFDIDRYLPERMEHAAPGAYAPFGHGSHSCIGAGLARVLVPLVVATLLHGAELEAGHPGRKLKIKYLPVMHPADSFTFQVAHRR